MDYMKSGEILNDSKSQTINIPEVGTGRWVYAYPSSLGNVSSIVDGNGFNQMGGVSSYDVTIADPITNENVSYKLYIQNNSADISNIIIKIS